MDHKPSVDIAVVVQLRILSVLSTVSTHNCLALAFDFPFSQPRVRTKSQIRKVALRATFAYQRGNQRAPRYHHRKFRVTSPLLQLNLLNSSKKPSLNVRFPVWQKA